MRKHTVTYSLILLGGAVAHGQIVNAYWSFGDTGILPGTYDGATTVTAHTMAAAPVMSGTGSLILLSTAPGLAFTAYDSVEYAAGAAMAWNANSTGNSFSVQLDMSGLEDLQLRMDYRHRLVTTFSAFSAIEYSVDGGAFATAITSPTFTASSGSEFYSFEYGTLDFSSLAAIENQSDVVIRFSFADMPATSSSFRIENVQLQAVVVPEPSTYAALTGLLALGLVALRRRRR